MSKLFPMLAILVLGTLAHAQATQPATRPVKTQEELEAGLSKLLSNATLEGSFTSTARGSDPNRVNSDKYTLGAVQKIAGKMWLIQAKIQYRGNDILFPLTLPIEWAGDTPVIVVDNFTIPGMGTFNARVMFFDGHYSGYWSHGPRGGNMFGVIKPAEAPTTAPAVGQ